MGKLGPRLNTRKKAKRWPKGQSSSSNPETKKHREQAAWMFFKDFNGTPGITKEDLQRHDAIQGIQPRLESLDLGEDQAESTTEGTVNTLDSFASSYSNCSNMSFNRFLNHFQSSSLLHKEMLAVLSAVTEVIKQNGGNESSTEYFAALMSTLEALETQESIAATLSLLGMNLKTVPKNVLNVQFGSVTKILLKILSKYATMENYLVLRHCLGCLSILLRAQERAVWTISSTIQVINAILSFAIHAKPKVRKSAQHGICAILKGSDIMRGDNPPPFHPAAPHVAKYCIAQMDLAAQPGGITSVLHILTLLKDIMHQLPKFHVKAVCEGLLKIMGLKNVLVTSCCLQTFHGLFVSRPSDSILPAQRNAQIIMALYDYQPPATDAQPTLAWLAVMQEAHCNLAKRSLNLCAANITRMLEKCIDLWLSDKQEVISGSSHTFKTLLEECISPLCENEEQTKRYQHTIDHVILITHKAMGYQYLEAWHHVLHLVALLFQTTGKTGNPKLLEIIKSLAELRDSHNFSHCSETEYAIGAAIRAMGPDIVLKTLPLRIDENEIDMQRTWLVPLLKDCITHGSLSFFTNNLLPLAVMCENKSKEPNGKAYELLVSQLWAILPSICHNADDVTENFKNIAKLLGMVISEKKNIRPFVMAALRTLITKAVERDHKDHITELARYAKNYLPLLFNLYTIKPNGTDEAGQRLAAFDTIKKYLCITSTELANELFDRAMTKLKEPNNENFFKESVYDLIRALIEYTDTDRLKTFYDMCIPFLKDASKQREQKKAYRFLEEICGSERELCKNYVQQYRREIQKTFVSCATTVARTSKGARLRCLAHLVKYHPQLENTKFLEAIVPEAVLSVKDVNQKCRASAYNLLNMIAEKFLGNSEHLKAYTNMLLAGLGGVQKYCSATLLALASVTYRYNGSLGVETIKEILNHACTLVVCPTREVAESALSYIKVYITVMPSPNVASTLSQIIEALSGMNDDCKRHFRQKVRDIFIKLVRKYGIATISGMVPATDAMLQKRLKVIHKVEETKKKNRELRRMKEQENSEDSEFSAKRRPKSIEDILADSEEEFEGTENEEEPRKNKKRTSRKEAWIKENEDNIMDLIDPAAARNITTTRPGVINTKAPAKKSKDHGFKIAPDGRFIIADGNREDSDTEEKKKKTKLPFLHSDSEDDYEGDEEDAKSVMTTKSMGRKRKHSVSSDVVSMRSQSTSRYQAGGSGIHRPLKANKTERLAGEEYRAAKAGGDIKKKGKPDPYAYLPLTRSALNKRKKKKNAGKFQNIIAGAKKGARIGTKNKKKQ